MLLSDKAATALAACYATRGKHKGKLLARCPHSTTLAAAAWQGAMLSINPYKVGIASVLFMTAEQRAIYTEVAAYWDAVMRDRKADAIAQDRDRQALDALGVW